MLIIVVIVDVGLGGISAHTEFSRAPRILRRYCSLDAAKMRYSWQSDRSSEKASMLGYRCIWLTKHTWSTIRSWLILQTHKLMYQKLDIYYCYAIIYWCKCFSDLQLLIIPLYYLLFVNIHYGGLRRYSFVLLSICVIALELLVCSRLCKAIHSWLSCRWTFLMQKGKVVERKIRVRKL